MVDGEFMQPGTAHSELRHRYEDARSRASRLGRGLRDLAIEQPVISALGAFGCGFIIGRIFSRL